MSRHRGLQQYMDDYDNDGADNFDDYSDDDSGAEEQARKPPPSLSKTGKPKQQPAPKKTTTQEPRSQSKAGSFNPATAASVLSTANQQALAGLERFATDNGLKLSKDDLRKALDKNNWNQDAAAEELTMRMVALSIAPSQPQSTFSKVLDERPALKKPSESIQGGLTVTKPPRKPDDAFDFSTPSPDDIIAEARRKQDRTAPAIVVEPAKPLKDSGVAKRKEDSGAAVEIKKVQGEATIVTKTKAEEKRDQDDDAADAGKKPLLSLVVVGHVDAGKSTLMGHLLYELNYVSQKDMHKFEKESKELGKASFRFAWVMDEHAEERERGVTIDVGIKRFETPNRRIVLLDAPGHKDFVPNMIAGAAQADAAVLVVPAVAGEFESSFSLNGQTKEHAILVHRLGVQKLIVAVNKMDSCAWDKSRFDFIQSTLAQFLKDEVGFDDEDVTFVPCSGLSGDNLAKRGTGPPDWVPPRTLVDALDALPAAKRPSHKPLRVTVAEAYKSMQLGSLTVGGKVESGVLRVDDTLLIRPLNVSVRVKAMASHGQPTRRAKAGDNVEIGLLSKDASLFDQLTRQGIVLCDPNAPVPVVTEVRARINTLSAIKFPLLNGSQLMMHAHSVAVPCTVKTIEKTLGAEGKNAPRMVKRNETAEVILVLASPVCMERMDDLKPLARFLLRFSGVTVAAGMVVDILKQV